jgi:uncharacterized protein
VSENFRPQLGAVFSADIAVPQHELEVRFYSRVLSTGGEPLWRETDLMNSLCMPIIGLGGMSPEYKDLPLQWTPHIQVADVATSVDRARRLGGSVLMHAEDDAASSQWAVLLDPHGAAFGIVPVVVADAAATAASGSSAPISTGRIYWLDLTVPDAPRSRDFYMEVVGWGAHDVPMKDAATQYADYNMLRKDGSPAAGVCHARGVNADLPPVWMIYLPVGDLAESVRRVETEGGRVIRSMRDGSGALLYAAVMDPVGACFALVQA